MVLDEVVVIAVVRMVETVLVEVVVIVLVEMVGLVVVDMAGTAREHDGVKAVVLEAAHVSWLESQAICSQAWIDPYVREVRIDARTMDLRHPRDNQTFEAFLSVLGDECYYLGGPF